MRKFTKGKTLACIALSLVLAFPVHEVNAAEIKNLNAQTQIELATVTVNTSSQTALLEEVKEKASFTIQTTVENEVVPIKIPGKGVLKYSVSKQVLDYAGAGYVTIFEDAQCTTKMDSSLYLSQYGTAVTGATNTYIDSDEAYFSKGGEYYVQFETPGLYTFTSTFVNGASRIIADRQTTYAYGNKSYSTANTYDSTNIYYKYTAKETGVVTLSMDFLNENKNGSAYITVYDSNKRAVSEEVYISSNLDKKAIFGVYKGRSYYFKVHSYSGLYAIRCTLTPITEYSGRYKTQPKHIALNKYYKGTILPENYTTSSDWYKFTLTKPTKVALCVRGNVSSGSIYVTVTGSTIGGSAVRRISKLGYASADRLTTYSSTTLPRGTYYIRVNKQEKISSGYYAVGIKTY